MADRGTTDGSIEHLPEGVSEEAPEGVERQRTRAELAMEVLEGKGLGSLSAYLIENIQLNEAVETQIENMQHLYGASLLMAAYLVSKKRDLDFPVRFDSFSNINRSDLATNAPPEQVAALSKLKEVIGDKKSKVSKFWRKEILDHFNDDLRGMIASTDAAVSVMSGDESPTPPEEKGFLREKWEDTKKFVSEHPRTAGVIAIAGALGIGFALSRFFKKRRRQQTTGTVGADGTVRVEVDTRRRKGVFGILDDIWKWTKRAFFVAGGIYVAGQVLGNEKVQNWLSEKGIEVDDNRFLKALALFADFKLLEGVETLKRGALSDTDEEFYGRAAGFFGLGSAVSVWVCGDEKFSEFMKYNFDGDVSFAGRTMAGIPLIGKLFTRKGQLEDEKKMQERFKEDFEEIKNNLPGWKNMTITEIIQQMYQGEFGTVEDSAVAGRLTPEEQEEARENREQNVEEPSRQFDAVMASVSENEEISGREKDQLLELLGDTNEKGTLLGDLENLRTKLPTMTGQWVRHFGNAIGSIGSGLGFESMENFGSMMGPDIDDTNEMVDFEAARDQLALSMAEYMVGTDMEVVTYILSRAQEFRQFIVDLEAGKPLSEEQLRQFEEYKDEFLGKDGYFYKVKDALDKANNFSTADRRDKDGEIVWDPNGNAVVEFLEYSFLDVPTNFFMKITSEEDPLTGDDVLAMSMTAGTTFVVLKPVTTAKLAYGAYRLGGYPKASYYKWWINRTLKNYKDMPLEDAQKAYNKIVDLKKRYGDSSCLDMIGRQEATEVRRAATDAMLEMSDNRPELKIGGTIDEAAELASTPIRAADDLAKALEAGDVGDNVMDDLAKALAKIEGSNPQEALVSLKGCRGDATRSGNIARMLIDDADAKAALEAAESVGDTKAAALARRRRVNIRTFARKQSEVLTASADALKLLREQDGLGNMTDEVAYELFKKYPRLREASNADEMADVLVEIRSGVKALRSITGVRKANEMLLRGALRALRAQKALAGIGIVADLFFTGLAWRNMKQIEQLAEAAENPAMKEIYLDAAERQKYDMALSITSAGVVLVVWATVGASTAGIAALATLPIVLVVSGSLYVADKVDEAKIEMARDVADWKRLSSAQLYTEWVTMVGLNDGEKVMAYVNPDTFWSSVLSVGDISERRRSLYKLEKKVSRIEIVEALIERQFGIFGSEAERSEEESALKDYAFQYARAALGSEFDAETVQEAKEIIDKSVWYAKLMVARDQLEIRREFMEGLIRDGYIDDLAPTQVRLTPEQIAVLPMTLRSSYNMVIQLTSFVDLMPDSGVLSQFSDVLPEGGKGHHVSDIEKVDEALNKFVVGANSYLGEKLSRKHPELFENFQKYEPDYLASKWNELKMLLLTGASMTKSMYKVLPVLEDYLIYSGLHPTLNYTFPTSVRALDRWCIDVMSVHQVPEGVLSEHRDRYMRTDEEIIAEYGVSKNKFLYAIYRLAVVAFGYSGSSSEEALKGLYSEHNRNVFGLYWNGKRWVVQEAGWESDNELPDTENYDRLLKKLIGEIRRHKDDLFEQTSEFAFVLSDNEPLERSEQIAEYFIEILTQAGEEFQEITEGDFETECIEYIKAHGSGADHVVLPGYLLSKGIMAGVNNLGMFSYRFEDGQVVCYRMTSDARIEKPAIFESQGDAFEAYERIDVSGYRGQMMHSVDSTYRLIHSRGVQLGALVTLRKSEDELDTSEALDDMLAKKREEIDDFIESLSSYPPEKQEELCREKTEEIAEFKRVFLLSVFSESANGLLSDDADSETLDENILAHLSTHSTFEDDPALRKHWEDLENVFNKIVESVEGERYADQYLYYFKQQMSLVLLESIVLKEKKTTREIMVQRWKGLEKDELRANISDLLLYNEWSNMYKGTELDSTREKDRKKFETSVVKALF